MKRTNIGSDPQLGPANMKSNPGLADGSSITVPVLRAVPFTSTSPVLHGGDLRSGLACCGLSSVGEPESLSASVGDGPKAETSKVMVIVEHTPIFKGTCAGRVLPTMFRRSRPDSVGFAVWSA